MSDKPRIYADANIVTELGLYGRGWHKKERESDIWLRRAPMHVILTIIAFYFVYVLLTAVLIRKTMPRRASLAFIVIAALTPVLTVLAIVSTFFDFLKITTPEPEPCPARFGVAEKLVEERRAEVFHVPEGRIWIANFLTERYRIHISRQAESINDLLCHKMAA